MSREGVYRFHFQVKRMGYGEFPASVIARYEESARSKLELILNSGEEYKVLSVELERVEEVGS